MRRTAQQLPSIRSRLPPAAQRVAASSRAASTESLSSPTSQTLPTKDSSEAKVETNNHTEPAAAAATETVKPRKKTMAELDEELRLMMECMSGDGGASGVEYEDGKPSAMKRSVRNNMFRYI